MANLKGIIFLVRSTGLMNLLRIMVYTLKREWLNLPYRRAAAARQRSPQIFPGRLISQQEMQNGASFHYENADLDIEFLTIDLVRISWRPGRAPAPYAQAKTDWEAVQTQLSQAFEGWRISSPGMQVLVSQEGGIQFINAYGVLLRDELPPGRQNQSWKQLSRLHNEECIYGLGEQSGPFNLRGTTHQIWNIDPGGSYGPGADPLYMPLPVYFGLNHNGSYLIFYENSFPAKVSFTGSHEGENPQAEICFEDGMLRYYFIAGTPEIALQRFSELTGRAELPPRWSLGYHQSRWGYSNDTDIRQVVEGFKENNLPLSAIHLDIDYMRGYRVFTIDKQRFPDLQGLSQELETLNVKLITIIDPAVKQEAGFSLYESGLTNDMFCKLPNGKVASGIVWPGISVYPDFTDPKVRHWWGEQYPVLLDAGVAGIWHDMNEPSSFSAFGGHNIPLVTRHSLEGQGGNHHQAHNLYGLQMNRAAHEALRRLRPDRRPWIFSRSGWVSLQRFAWNWTADTASTWDALKMTIASVLGLGLSGIPFSGPDIGGFSGDPPAELYLRWFQMAAFMPFFRTHSAIGTPRREPWVYGEPYTTIIREFMHLRQQLLPYFYTLAWQASTSGHPMLRPVFWVDSEDRNLWRVDDAFMLGDDLLVAPVLTTEQDQRDLRLPAGRWYHFWDDRIYQGPASVILPVNLEQIPLLVRAGSVLPMVNHEKLVLHIYATEDNPLQLPPQKIYSDAGDGYGSHRIDNFQISNQNGSVAIRWLTEGDYPLPYNDIKFILHVFPTVQVQIDAPQITIPINVHTFQSETFNTFTIHTP